MRCSLRLGKRQMTTALNERVSQLQRTEGSGKVIMTSQGQSLWCSGKDGEVKKRPKWDNCITRFTKLKWSNENRVTSLNYNTTLSIQWHNETPNQVLHYYTDNSSSLFCSKGMFSCFTLVSEIPQKYFATLTVQIIPAKSQSALLPYISYYRMRALRNDLSARTVKVCM
jgi:hypothetical protein